MFLIGAGSKFLYEFCLLKVYIKLQKLADEKITAEMVEGKQL